MQENRQHVAVFSTYHVCFLEIFSTVFEFKLKISFFGFSRSVGHGEAHVSSLILAKS
jgi:hypothetical protein